MNKLAGLDTEHIKGPAVVQHRRSALGGYALAVLVCRVGSCMAGIVA